MVLLQELLALDFNIFLLETMEDDVIVGLYMFGQIVLNLFDITPDSELAITPNP